MLSFCWKLDLISSFEIVIHRKCPLRGHILAPLEGLRARGLSGVNLGVDPGSQGVIPRRFKRKKIFVTDGRTDKGWTDRRVGRNSDVDGYLFLPAKI